MPKSSTASRTPSARSSSSVPTVAGQVDQQQALGDLQDQVRRVQAGLVQRRAHRVDQARLVQLAGRQVDADRHRRAWSGSRACQARICRQASRSTKRPIGHDQPGLLGQRDEVQRRHQPALGVLPADQRLDPGQPAGRQLHGRLVVDGELARARRRGRARPSAASWPMIAESMSGAKTADRPLPASLAAYIATSACRSSSAASCCPAAPVAMPTLAVIRTCAAARRRAVRTARPGRRAAARRRPRPAPGRRRPRSGRRTRRRRGGRWCRRAAGRCAAARRRRPAARRRRRARRRR